jgi:hypothetical protein
MISAILAVGTRVILVCMVGLNLKVMRYRWPSGVAGCDKERSGRMLERESPSSVRRKIFQDHKAVQGFERDFVTGAIVVNFRRLCPNFRIAALPLSHLIR